MQNTARTFRYTAQSGPYISTISALLFIMVGEASGIVLLIVMLLSIGVLKWLLVSALVALYLFIMGKLLMPLWTKHRLSATHLQLHYGMDFKQSIPRECIVAVERVRERVVIPMVRYEAEKQRLNIAFSEHGQLLLRLGEPYPLQIGWGKKVFAEKILLNVDRPDELLAALGRAPMRREEHLQAGRLRTVVKRRRHAVRRKDDCRLFDGADLVDGAYAEVLHLFHHALVMHHLAEDRAAAACRRFRRRRVLAPTEVRRQRLQLVDRHAVLRRRRIAPLDAIEHRRGQRRFEAEHRVGVGRGLVGLRGQAGPRLVNRGDRVVLCDPCSPLYPLAVRTRKARVRWLPTWAEDGRTRFRTDHLARALAPALATCGACKRAPGVAFAGVPFASPDSRSAGAPIRGGVGGARSGPALRVAQRTPARRFESPCWIRGWAV